ncbi:MAG: transposase [Betaproteobacteria bacterium]|nr:transposase [Betaproteobacteria bacterium]MBK8319189.1 transposase [Betaproteobacteria bacterium]MBK9785168.1 transposase [Candidatus Dechloromonas phosphorivorans]
MPWNWGPVPDRRKVRREAQTLALIRAIDAEVRCAYGSPRMARALGARGFPAGRERVERPMRENGIRARHKRRYTVTTDLMPGPTIYLPETSRRRCRTRFGRRTSVCRSKRRKR